MCMFEEDDAVAKFVPNWKNRMLVDCCECDLEFTCCCFTCFLCRRGDKCCIRCGEDPVALDEHDDQDAVQSHGEDVDAENEQPRSQFAPGSPAGSQTEDNQTESVDEPHGATEVEAVAANAAPAESDQLDTADDEPGDGQSEAGSMVADPEESQADEERAEDSEPQPQAATGSAAINGEATLDRSVQDGSSDNEEGGSSRSIKEIAAEMIRGVPAGSPGQEPWGGSPSESEDEDEDDGDYSQGSGDEVIGTARGRSVGLLSYEYVQQHGTAETSTEPGGAEHGSPATSPTGAAGPATEVHHEGIDIDEVSPITNRQEARVIDLNRSRSALDRARVLLDRVKTDGQ